MNFSSQQCLQPWRKRVTTMSSYSIRNTANGCQITTVASNSNGTRTEARRSPNGTISLSNDGFDRDTRILNNTDSRHASLTAAFQQSRNTASQPQGQSTQGQNVVREITTRDGREYRQLANRQWERKDPSSGRWENSLYAPPGF